MNGVVCEWMFSIWMICTTRWSLLDLIPNSSCLASSVRSLAPFPQNVCSADNIGEAPSQTIFSGWSVRALAPLQKTGVQQGVFERPFPTPQQTWTLDTKRVHKRRDGLNQAYFTLFHDIRDILESSYASTATTSNQSSCKPATTQQPLKHWFLHPGGGLPVYFIIY